MKTIYFIINPQAKNGYCQKIWRRLEQILLEKKVPYMAFFTEYRGHAKEIVHTLASKKDGRKLIVVAVGGDGTIHEVVNGAAPFQHVHVSFIPGGSGNDFSRGYQISNHPSDVLRDLIQQLDQNHVVLIDTGEIKLAEKKRIFFINNMGAGFDALISKQVNQSKMKRIFNRLYLGKFIYVYFLLKNLFTYKKSRIDLTVDGIDYTFPSAWFVTVSNQPFYGGGMKISPHASPVDGKLNITVVHQLSKAKLLLVFMTVFWGGHTRFKEVSLLTGRSIQVHSDIPLHVHADGEDVGMTPVNITVCHQHLPVIVNGLFNDL